LLDLCYVFLYKWYVNDYHYSINDYYLHCEGSVSVLEHLNYIKDLGETFDSELKFNLHIDVKVNKAYSVLVLYIEISNICLQIH